MCQIWEDEDKREKYRNVYKRLIDFNKNEKNKKKNNNTHERIYTNRQSDGQKETKKQNSR